MRWVAFGSLFLSAFAMGETTYPKYKCEAMISQYYTKAGVGGLVGDISTAKNIELSEGKGFWAQGMGTATIKPADFKSIYNGKNDFSHADLDKGFTVEIMLIQRPEGQKPYWSGYASIPSGPSPYVELQATLELATIEDRKVDIKVASGDHKPFGADRVNATFTVTTSNRRDGVQPVALSVECLKQKEEAQK